MLCNIAQRGYISEGQDISEVPMCFPAQVLIQQVAIFIGDESFLLGVVVIFVAACGGRRVEEGTQVAISLEDEVSVAGSDLQLVQP